jgi:hypothetical protein
MRKIGHFLEHGVEEWLDFDSAIWQVWFLRQQYLSMHVCPFYQSSQLFRLLPLPHAHNFFVELISKLLWEELFSIESILWLYVSLERGVTCLLPQQTFQFQIHWKFPLYFVCFPEGMSSTSFVLFTLLVGLPINTPFTIFPPLLSVVWPLSHGLPWFWGLKLHNRCIKFWVVISFFKNSRELLH